MGQSVLHVYDHGKGGWGVGGRGGAPDRCLKQAFSLPTDLQESSILAQAGVYVNCDNKITTLQG